MSSKRSIPSDFNESSNTRKLFAIEERNKVLEQQLYDIKNSNISKIIESARSDCLSNPGQIYLDPLLNLEFQIMKKKEIEM